MLRLLVQDGDLPFTSAWRVKFRILNGNEEGHFDIFTDPKTNEGILNVIKVKPSGKAHLPGGFRVGAPFRRSPDSEMGASITECPLCARHVRRGVLCVPVAPSEEGGLCSDHQLPQALGPFAFVAPPTKIRPILKIRTKGSDNV